MTANQTLLLTLQPVDNQAVEVALANLGDTPSKVRDSLMALGASGRPESNEECPVAVYLKYLFRIDIRVGNCNIYYRDLSMAGHLPKPVQAFIRCFDSGGFPELAHEW